MREIKFRAWDKENRVMFYSEDNQNDDFTFISEKRGLQFYYIDKSDRYLQDTNSVLMQYSGLKDKNGRDIYEGDILKGNYMACTEFNVIVRFGEYEQDGSGAEYGPSVCVGFYAEAINKEQENEYGYKIVDEYMKTSSLFDFKEIEVIGNIYEDKHLLEGDPNA